MVKIKCPNCNNKKIRGVFFESRDDLNGEFKVKCNKCKEWILLKIENGSIKYWKVIDKNKII